MIKGFTIIIPTMWFHPFMLFTMIKQYSLLDQVKEILVINNRGDKLKIPFKKVRVLGTGDNMFVCPAWNLAVSETKTNKIIIANDDILISKPKELIEEMDSLLEEGVVVGLDASSYSDKKMSPDVVTGITYGFGVFMAMYKKSYVPIPDEFKVWYGDTIQWKKNKAVTVSGYEVETPMRGTSAKLDLRKQRVIERKAWKTYRV